jgi:hypothetical protein
MSRNKKLGIIVPYRDRPEHLKEFARRIVRYMERFEDLPYEIFIISQDNAKLFNRGMLLNIGFLYAEKSKCDYVVFHDVDMIPHYADYTYSEIPLHLSNHFLVQDRFKDKELFDEYFGGVTMFTKEDFRKIDGYSNKYWGWGYEDTDLLYRCRRHEIELATWDLKNMGKPKQALAFNGVNSYVIGEKNFRTNTSVTFFISFYPEDVFCDVNRVNDDYSVFSIPGYDTSISYNSFSRYNFCTFDVANRAVYINSKIKPNYKTNLCVTIDSDTHVIEMYQDGYKVGETDYYDSLRSYIKEKYFYLGVGDPSREGDEKFFKGYITKFAVFEGELTRDEIYDISTNEDFNLSQNFNNYTSSHKLKTYYDTDHIENYKLTDLSGNNNHGKIKNCEIVQLEFDEIKEVLIPHRRDSTFILLGHKENGFYRNKWRQQATRWNQLRFYNEVVPNDLIYNDGLSTCDWIEYGVKKINNKIKHIDVGI